VAALFLVWVSRCGDCGSPVMFQSQKTTEQIHGYKGGTHTHALFARLEYIAFQKTPVNTGRLLVASHTLTCPQLCDASQILATHSSNSSVVGIEGPATAAAGCSTVCQVPSSSLRLIVCATAHGSRSRGIALRLSIHEGERHSGCCCCCCCAAPIPKRDGSAGAPLNLWRGKRWSG
jgi:hypothetical protein